MYHDHNFIEAKIMYHDHKFKGKGSKNKNIAREFGGAFAQHWFESMLNTEEQGVLFNWNSIPEIVKIGLNIHYQKTPDNILELKEISHDSFAYQYSKLKEKHISENGCLPVRNDSVDVIENAIIEVTTKSHIHISKVNFYAEKKKENINDLDNIWKALYVNEVSVEFLKNGGLERAKNLSKMKNISQESTKKVIQKVSDYYDNIKDISDCLG